MTLLVRASIVFSPAITSLLCLPPSAQACPPPLRPLGIISMLLFLFLMPLVYSGTSVQEHFCLWTIQLANRSIWQNFASVRETAIFLEQMPKQPFFPGSWNDLSLWTKVLFIPFAMRKFILCLHRSAVSSLNFFSVIEGLTAKSLLKSKRRLWTSTF